MLVLLKAVSCGVIYIYAPPRPSLRAAPCLTPPQPALIGPGVTRPNVTCGRLSPSAKKRQGPRGKLKAHWSWPLSLRLGRPPGGGTGLHCTVEGE